MTDDALVQALRLAEILKSVHSPKVRAAYERYARRWKSGTNETADEYIARCKREDAAAKRQRTANKKRIAAQREAWRLKKLEKAAADAPAPLPPLPY